MNPALDEAISIGHVDMGEINRCALDALDPGGKGINASRVIKRLGRSTSALGFAGGVTGSVLRARLDEEGVPNELIEVPGFTRINVMLFEGDSRRRTRFYLPGPAVDSDHLALLRGMLEKVEPGPVVVLGGSLPPGIPDDAYAMLCSWLQARGSEVIIDASGSALRAALATKPLLIKPDLEEAQELLGRELQTEAQIVAAATELLTQGPRNVVISCGAHGAIGVGPDGCWKATPPKVIARSTVGSGDSMVAGLAIAFAERRGLVEGLRLGSAAGAATAMLAGTHLANLDDIERLLPAVELSELDYAPSGNPPRWSTIG
jgi:1-phosphofructokinase